MTTTIAEQIRNLSDREFDEKVSEIERAIFQRRNEIDRRQEKARRLKNQQRREREAEISAAARTWCRNNLKTGMYVKLTGTRDKQGLREITEIQGDCLVGRKIIVSRRLRQDPVTGGAMRNARGFRVVESVFVPSGEWTTNGLEKVREVYIEGTWRTIQEITGV